VIKKIILASASPRRKELLKKAGLKAEVFPSSIFEKTYKSPQDPKVYALLLAKAKAENVAKKFSDAVVIAADTIVLVENKIFGKPKNKSHSVRMLRTLSGKIQYVYTALAVIDTRSQKTILDIEKTTILAKRLSRIQIKQLSEQNHDKAGAYAVQKDSDILVKKMLGDYYNVVGLPIKRLKQILKIFHINMQDLN
jgi:septum formation protein